MGILFYVVVNIISLSYFITTVSSVEICNNQTLSGRSVNLSNMYGSGESCGCSVNLVDSDRNSNVTFQATQNPSGCQYKLMFRLKNETREYSCEDRNDTYQFLMTPTDHLYFNLMNDKNNTSGFVITFNISSDTNVTLSCRSPWTHPNLVTTQPTTTVEENSFHSESPSVQTESTGTTEKNMKAEELDNMDLPIILGCSIGGTVIIILVIIIIVCVLLRRKKTQTGDKIENPKHDDMIITENEVYLSSDSIPNNTSQYGTKNMTKMEIIPNDLYQSSDDLTDSEPREHIPTTSTEYAVVKKTPKKVPKKDKEIELNNNRNKTRADYENIEKDKLNLKIEIERIVGPKGDDYTLVNKF